MPDRPLRVLSLSHVVRDPTGGASGASLELNAALRSLGHVVDEMYADDLVCTGSARARKERIPVEIAKIALRSANTYDVIDVTGHGAWIAFPVLRAKRTAGRYPLLVARSYGLEHFDHEVRVQEHRAGKRRLSLAYRLGGGFLNLREVEIGVAAADLWAVGRPGAAAWAESRHLKRPGHSVTAGFGVDELFFTRRADPVAGRIAWMGSMVERKGWEYFIEGFTRAASLNSELTLAAFGTGADQDDVRAEFPAEIRERIAVFPKLEVKTLIAELSSCAAFVSTSLSEGYHLATLQAMALGIPVIATREGFLADIADDEPLVYREIAKRDPRAVADALMAQTNGSEQETVTQNAKNFALSRSWINVARVTSAAYKQNLGR